MGRFIAGLLLLTICWITILVIGLWDAVLISLFLNWSGVTFLASLSYWQVFWLNVAAMMPVGTIIGVFNAMKPSVEELL